MLTKILNIIPKKQHVLLKRFFIQSLFLNVLDLLSIAYLIPIITILFDKNKFYEVLENVGISNYTIAKEHIQISVFILVLFYLIKNILHTKFNKKFFLFLHTLASDISAITIKNYLNKDFSFYKKQNKGHIMHMVLKVAGDFSCKFLHSCILLSSEVFLLLIVASFLFFFYPLFSSIALLILGIFSTIIYFKKKSDFNIINSTYNEFQTSTNSKLINILDGYLAIKSSDNEAYFINNFDTDNRKLNQVTSLLVSSSFNYSKYLETALIICIGCLAYFNFVSNQNTILFISTLAALGFKIIPSFSKILNAITHIKSHHYTIEILEDIIDTTPQNTNNEHFETFESINFQNVSFNYDANSQILNQIDFNIKPGDFIGITGVSGIGKTTFLYLIMGLIKPSKGVIKINNTPATDKSFLPLLSYVSQQPFLLSGTVLENITMGQKETDIDYEYIEYLCKKLQLTDSIVSLPEQYQTRINHDSLRFSGGQKQRICIARALYKKPKLLIIDEATNQQNSQLEQHIFQFLQELVDQTDLAILSVSHNDHLTSFYSVTYKMETKKLLQIG